MKKRLFTTDRIAKSLFSFEKIHFNTGLSESVKFQTEGDSP